jgi:Acyl-protein synthetase, LuxE
LVKRTTTSAAAERGETNVTQAILEANQTTDDVARQLGRRVLAFIATPSETDFDSLALDVHGYQYRLNGAYRRFVDRLGHPPPRSWREIPAVPAEAFRMSVLACGSAERTYLSSGTTAGLERRAQHHVPDVAVYRASALTGFARAVLPAGVRRRFLIAAPERSSHVSSSLGEMVSWLRATYDLDTVPSFLGTDGVDLAGLAGRLDQVDAEAPVVVFAVTSALLRLVDWADVRGRRFDLPASSLLIDTGGCKGYERDLARSEILARYRRVLGIEPEQVVNEYGMTELGSQLYARGEGMFRPPPWLKVLVIDLRTGHEVAEGEIGCLRFFDLANLGSVLAVQTEDLGRAKADGIELLGRVPGATTRGCSLLGAEPAA